jgi:ABC-type protease/lipase transport system fused ATPase/permease subunit
VENDRKIFQDGLMTLVPVKQVIEAWHKMCEQAQSIEDIEELTIVLGRAKEFLITQDGQQFYITEEVKALIPLN